MSQFFENTTGLIATKTPMGDLGVGGMYTVADNLQIAFLNKGVALAAKAYQTFSYDSTNNAQDIVERILTIHGYNVVQENVIAARHNSAKVYFLNDKGDKDINSFIYVKEDPITKSTYLYTAGPKELVGKLNSSFSDEFNLRDVEKTFSIDWRIRNNEGKLTKVTNIYKKNEFPIPDKALYPFITTEDITKYFDDFIASDSTILLLVGPPGTGKTTFIRSFLSYYCRSTLLMSTRKEIHPEDISLFMENRNNVAVFEDADNLIARREDKNNSMADILSLADGVIPLKEGKFIFSTNITDINQIDPALMRPGRCFDMLEFMTYTSEEALVAAMHIGISKEVFLEHKDSCRDWSLAEIYNLKNKLTSNSPLLRRSFKKMKSIGFMS